MADLQYAICPYNKDHRILKFRMPGHIIKCMRNYSGPPLVICKYNATHRLPAENMAEHFEVCEDYRKFHEYTNSQIAFEFRTSPPRF